MELALDFPTRARTSSARTTAPGSSDGELLQRVGDVFG